MATKPEQYDGGPVADMILDGHYDEDMDIISDALRSRREHVRAVQMAKTAATLRAGDTVQVVGRIKPRYLIGLRGTVERVDAKRAYIMWLDSDRFMAKRYGGRTLDNMGPQRTAIGVPLSCVEKIEPTGRVKRPDQLGKPSRARRANGAKRSAS